MQCCWGHPRTPIHRPMHGSNCTPGPSMFETQYTTGGWGRVEVSSSSSSSSSTLSRDFLSPISLDPTACVICDLSLLHLIHCLTPRPSKGRPCTLHCPYSSSKSHHFHTPPPQLIPLSITAISPHSPSRHPAANHRLDLFTIVCRQGLMCIWLHVLQAETRASNRVPSRVARHAHSTTIAIPER